LSSLRRLCRALFRIAAALLIAIIVAGLVGQIVRDRSVTSALLMYLPLLPASLAAIVLDVCQRGRALPKVRFLLTSLGLFGGVWAALLLIGSGAVGKYGPADCEVTLLHWNVLWGGGPFPTQKTWAAQRASIVERNSDVIILSELPPADQIRKLVDAMGPGADFVGIQHDERFRLGVCSRWPMQLEERMPLPGGAAMSVTVMVRGRPMRLLVVDGQSNPFHSRLPFLAAIAEICRGAANHGRPFDVLAGDFNTPSRSIGFDALTTLGYQLTGRAAHGWRGTFPAFLPLYDIDHVWLGPGLRLRSCTFFNGPYSDHRGQFVSVLQPAAKSDSRLDQPGADAGVH
jgi:endonuclease/exonuclease/phosphatase (EEP) superfamily protein YafD